MGSVVQRGGWGARGIRQGGPARPRADAVRVVCLGAGAGATRWAFDFVCRGGHAGLLSEALEFGEDHFAGDPHVCVNAHDPFVVHVGVARRESGAAGEGVAGGSRRTTGGADRTRWRGLRGFEKLETWEDFCDGGIVRRQRQGSRRRSRLGCKTRLQCLDSARGFLLVCLQCLQAFVGVLVGRL